MTILTLGRLLVLGAIWGASFPLIRHSVPAFGPAWIIEGRVVLGALAMTVLCLIQGRRLPVRGHEKRFLVMGFINSAFPFLCFGFAAQTFSASLLSIFNATTPIFAGILAAVLLKRKVSLLGWFGMAVGLSGVALIGYEGMAVKGDGVLMALIACFLAPLSYSYASIYVLQQADSIEPVDNAHGSLWAGALMLLPIALMSPAPVREAGWVDWSAVVMLGLGCTAWAYMLFFRLLADVGPVKALSVTFLIPLFGIFWGWLFLGEQVSYLMLGGGLLVLAGSALINLGPKSAA